MRLVLAEEFKDAEFREARDAREALSLLEQGRWDLLLLDISLPGRSGLDLMGEIKKLQPDLPVLVVSAHPEEEFGVRALRTGARGYVGKEQPVKDLLNAVRTVLEGGRYIGTKLAERLAVEMAHDFQAPQQRLSGREFEVLRLIARGENPKSIAATLSLSPKTVSTYRSRLLQKLHLKSDAELVRYALQNHLVE